MSSDLLTVTDGNRQASFSAANRAKRALWSVVYALLFRPSPRPMHAWRSMLLRAFGASIGRDCHVYPGVAIWAPWNLDFEDLVAIGDGAILYSMGRIKVGERTVISQGAHLCAGTHDYEDPSFQLVVRPITIGRKAWICADAFVGPGVTIGDGAVLGARGVAMKNLPPWSVWSGNPAVCIKQRSVQDEPSAEPR